MSGLTGKSNIYSSYRGDRGLYDSSFSPYSNGSGSEYSGQNRYAGYDDKDIKENSGIFLELREVLSGICRLSGRMRRRVWWIGYTEFTAISMMLMTICAGLLVKGHLLIGGVSLTLISILSVLVLVPASVKRLHDIGKSGWFYLLWFIPIGNIVVAIMILFMNSHQDNEYGPDPKRVPYDRYPSVPYGKMKARNIGSAVAGLIVILLITHGIYFYLIQSVFVPYALSMKGLGGALGLTEGMSQEYSDYLEDDEFFKNESGQTDMEDTIDAAGTAEGISETRDVEERLDDDSIQVKGPFSFERGVNSQDITVSVVNKEPYPVKYSLFIEGEDITSNLVQEIDVKGSGVGFAVEQVRIPILTDVTPGVYPISLTLVDNNERVLVKKFEIEITGNSSQSRDNWEEEYMEDGSYIISGGKSYEVGTDIVPGKYEVVLMSGTVVSVITGKNETGKKSKYIINLGCEVASGAIGEGSVVELEIGDMVLNSDGGEYKLVSQ